ncbi:DUF4097 family beta strand repeat-containing protein [Paenibacillus montanisoli]|uniref:DUF4097 domain-containing protein n=1 Tax=Paenibacillus montanisoli TaxID=2081970 RepID=A0A328U0U4_9BACL|nr:DUF4097 family beta strand repeat-containing protein [Paenibacillus montanisoli]RAP75672.1 hypothetical protein DL346_09440 [Paenibacillus montanisoli]
MFRKKRTLLLTSVAVLVFLFIADIWTRQVQLFEKFANQFVNEQKMREYDAAHPDVTATASRELVVKRKDIDQISLSGAGGTISVKRSSDPEVRLQYTVTVSASNQDDANRERDAVKVEEEFADGRLSFVSTADGKPIDPHSEAIDYVLLIPDEMKLSIASEYGSVLIDGIRGDVDVAAVSGMLEMVHVTGKISVTSTYSSAYLSDISGNIGLVNRSGDANLDQITGQITLDADSSRNFISRIKGGVSGGTVDGPVYLREITGPVKLQSKYSNIQSDQIQGDTHITSHSGQTKLILAEDEGYALHAKTSGGSIQTHLPIPIEQDQNDDNVSLLNGVVGDGTWRVEVEAISGDIVINSK